MIINKKLTYKKKHYVPPFIEFSEIEDDDVLIANTGDATENSPEKGEDEEFDVEIKEQDGLCISFSQSDFVMDEF